MSAEEYIRGLADKELQDELYRRNKKRAEAEANRRYEQYKREQEAEEAAERDFASGIGITYEQFLDVQAYVSDKIYDNR